MTRVTALFDSHSKGKQAVDELRSFGFPEGQLWLVDRNLESKQDGVLSMTVIATDMKACAWAGAVLGTNFGLTAALPGVDQSSCNAVYGAITSAASTGLIDATVGAADGAMAGTVDGVAGALVNAGYQENEASFFGREIEAGRVLVVVETDTAIADIQASAILNAHGGYIYKRNSGL